MKKAGLFIGIGVISGIVLAAFLKLIELIWGDHVYDLLFEVGYIPFLKELRPTWLAQNLFHFGTCILSIWILYNLLSLVRWQRNLWAYLLIIGVGSVPLFLLTKLSEKTPPASDIAGWSYWVIGHSLFSLTAFYLLKKWIFPLSGAKKKQSRLKGL